VRSVRFVLGLNFDPEYGGSCETSVNLYKITLHFISEDRMPALQSPQWRASNPTKKTHWECIDPNLPRNVKKYIANISSSSDE
jgi:hypothetical protein